MSLQPVGQLGQLSLQLLLAQLPRLQPQTAIGQLALQLLLLGLQLPPLALLLLQQAIEFASLVEFRLAQTNFILQLAQLLLLQGQLLAPVLIGTVRLLQSLLQGTHLRLEGVQLQQGPRQLVEQRAGHLGLLDLRQLLPIGLGRLPLLLAQQQTLLGIVQMQRLLVLLLLQTLELPPLLQPAAQLL